MTRPPSYHVTSKSTSVKCPICISGEENFLKNFLKNWLRKIDKISCKKWMKKETKFHWILTEKIEKVLREIASWNIKSVEWILTEKRDKILWEFDRERYWKKRQECWLEKTSYLPLWL